MAIEKFVVEGNDRDTRGKGHARRTRRTGMIPAVLYGGKKDSIALAVNAKQVGKILRSETGHNSIFKVQLGGKEEQAMVKDWQLDPLTGALIHVDLLRVAMDVRMRVRVPVHPVGEAQGVKLQGGIFEIVTREIEIECLPGDIPEEFKVDISDLMIGKQIRAGDIPLDQQKMKLVTDPSRVLFHVVTLKAEAEPTAEGAAVTAEATPAEPEVIKKGKKEEEGEEGAAPEKGEKAEKSEKKGKEK